MIDVNLPFALRRMGSWCLLAYNGQDRFAIGFNTLRINNSCRKPQTIMVIVHATAGPIDVAIVFSTPLSPCFTGYRYHSSLGSGEGSLI